MRKYDGEYKKVLNKLNGAEPKEVGKILKEYFNHKRRKKKS